MGKDISQIIEKVQGLLALARSDNPHEAGLAAARAQSMMLKYHLSMGEIGQASTQRSEITEAFFHYAMTQKGRSESWRKQLLQAVCTNNFAKVIICGDKANRFAVLVAKEVDVEYVKYLHIYLSETIERLSKRYSHLGDKGIQSFCTGAVTSVAITMAEQRLKDKAESQTCTALIIRNDAAVADKFDELYPDRRQSRSRASLDQRAYGMGRIEGSKIGINRAIDNQQRKGLM